MGLRDRDKASIRAFLERNSGLLGGTVIDFGSGQQPYRDVVVKAGGVYVPWDSTEFPGSCADEDMAFPTERADAVICNQVIQYLRDPAQVLRDMRVDMMVPRGWLLMTGPTNWPLVEKEDLWRFTPSGVELVLRRAGFYEITVEQREVFQAEGDSRWVIGWQAKARA